MRRLDGAAKRIQQSVVERDGEPSRAGRERRAPALPGRPRGAGRRLPRDRRRSSTTRSTSSRQLASGDSEHHRHPLRLPRPRRQDRRLPARQPDRDRRQAGHGQVHAGLRLRPERRDQAPEAGRPLLPGDVRDGARPPLHRLAVADLERPAPQGQGLEQGLAEGGQGLQPARVRAPLDRRLLRPRAARAARQGAAPARAGEGPRARRARDGDRRLPAADAKRRLARQPRRAGRRSSAAG